ncbi:hypothetical protein N2152v2_009813 [Parachlorella kessleri]
MYVPSDSKSPERKAAEALTTFFTFVACKIILAQLEGSGRGSLASYNAQGYQDLMDFLQKNPIKDGDEWLAKLMTHNQLLGVRIMEVREAYCQEDFEWDECHRLAVKGVKDANVRLMREYAAERFGKDLIPAQLNSPAYSGWLGGLGMGPRPSLVDGVSQEQLDRWFNIADADGDGRVANTEAVQFFLQSGLSPVELRKIYLLVKTPELNAREGVGLSKERFAQMLRLVALAQSGLPFTDHNAAAALDPASWQALHLGPLPAPRILLQTATTSVAGRFPGGSSGHSSSSSGNSQPAALGGSRDPFSHRSSLDNSLAFVAAATTAAGAGGAGPATQRGNPFAPADGRAHDSAFSHAAQGAAAAPTWDALDVSILESLVSPAKSQQQQLLQGASGAAAHATHTFEGIQPVAGDLGAPVAAADELDDDLFGLSKLAVRDGPAAGVPVELMDSGQLDVVDGGAAAPGMNQGQIRQLSRSRMAIDPMRSMERQASPSKLGPKEAPLAYDARLPPLNPKVSAKLSMLAAGSGSLFAGPGSKTGILQWANAESDLKQPVWVGPQGDGEEDAGTQLPRAPMEDWDAAPSAEVHVAARKEVACMMVDSTASVLWVGDKEGWVSGYDLSGRPGVAVGGVGSAPPQRLVYRWQAYRVGHVLTMCVTPQGELWTGSSRGNIRVWQLPGRNSSTDAPSEPLVCRELRRPMGERPHPGSVLALVCPSDGQLVWSASGKTILLWDAASGEFMGIVQKVIGKLGQGMVIDHAVGQAESLLKYNIRVKQGLELDPKTGAVIGRPSPARRSKLQLDQVAWALQTDKSMNELVERVSMNSTKALQGAGKAMRFIGKFGTKVARNLGGAERDSVVSKSGNYSTVLDAEQSAAGGSMNKSQSFSEDRFGRICAVITTHDNHVWVGYNKGRLDKFTAAGRLVWSKEFSGCLATMCSVGQHVWVGFANGMLSIVDGDGDSVRFFTAHGAGIISIAQAGQRTYTLAADGSIKGWNSALPDLGADHDALSEWDELASSCIRHDTVHMLCVTWNVGESKPSKRSPFFTQLDGKVNVTDPGIQLVVVGLQEIEMGGSSVALAAAKDALSYKFQERGNTNAKFWSASILEALGGEQRWYQLALRQLSGMLVLVFARTNLKNSIGEVATASVACGVLGVGGNKGAVAVEFTLHRHKVATICSHFAAHQKMVKERNANYEQIVKQLAFKRKPWFVAPPEDDDEDSQQADSLSASGKKRLPVVEQPGLPEAEARSEEGSEGPPGLEAAAEELLHTGEGMRNARLLVWLGDFNYRIDEYTYIDVKELITRESWAALLEKDQCRQQWAAGNVFRGLQEGPIAFRPTYKFDKGDSNPEAYDTSEKQRIPAWCDRVFFRGSAQEEEVLSSERVTARPLEYNTWLDVLDSDHKPVYARLEVGLPVTNWEKRRGICSELLQRCTAAEQAAGPPEGVQLRPLPDAVQGVQLCNNGQHAVRFRVVVDREAAATLGHAADALPVSGLVQPGGEATLRVLLGALDQMALPQTDGRPKVLVPDAEGRPRVDSATQLQLVVKVVVQPEFGHGGELAKRCRVLPFKLIWRRR